MEELIKVYEGKMEKSLGNLNEEFSTIRAGRANPHILDKIRVSVLEKNDEKNEKKSVDISIKNNKNVLESMSIVRNKNVYGLYVNGELKPLAKEEVEEAGRKYKSVNPT